MTVLKSSTLAAGILGLGLLLGGTTSLAQQAVRAQQELPDAAASVLRPVALDLQAQPMEQSLAELAQRTGLGMIFANDEVVRDLQAPAVRGMYAPEQALQALLAGSGLQHTYINAVTVAIRAVKNGQQDGQENAPPAPASGQNATNPEQHQDEGSDRPEGVSNLQLTLEEVVVSATKRESSVSDVPIAIQVFGAEAMQKLGIDDFSDYAQYAPGVSFTKRGAGKTHVVMRGLSTGKVDEAEPQNRALVGIYLDDVPIQLNGFNFDPDLYDMARVEVLKGPQGTLYGDSAMAGAIRYVSTPPNLFEHSARVDMSGSSTHLGEESFAMHAAANLPLIAGTMGLRTVFWHRDEAGWIDNVRRGRADVNTTKITGGRLTALYKPVEDLSIQTMVLAQRSRLGGQSESDIAQQLTQDRSNPEPFKDDALMANLTINWQLPNASLTSITGFLDRDLLNVHSTMERPFELLFGRHFARTLLTEPWKQRFVTQELRLSSSGERRIDYTAGIFVSRFTIDNFSYGSADGFAQHMVDQGFVPSLEALYALGCAPPEFPDHWFCSPLYESETRSVVLAKITNVTPIPEGYQMPEWAKERRDFGTQVRYIVERESDGWRLTQAWYKDDPDDKEWEKGFKVPPNPATKGISDFDLYYTAH